MTLLHRIRMELIECVLQPYPVLYLDTKTGLSALYALKLPARHVVDILDTSSKGKVFLLPVSVIIALRSLFRY